MSKSVVASPVVLAAAVLALAASARAADVPVALNVPSADLNVPAMTPVVTARYRLDLGGGVDQLLFKQPNPAGFPGANLVNAAPATPNAGKATYDFSFAYTAATRIYAFSLTGGTIAGGGLQFASNGSSRTVTQSFAAGELDYNILHLFLLSERDSVAAFSDLTFTPGSGLSTTGALQTAASVTNGVYDQWLVAPVGTNLADYDWTLAGKASLELTGQRPSAERIKFEITGKQGTAIPEPAAISLLAPAVALLVRRRR